MSTAKVIDQRMKQAGHGKPASILTIVSDDHNVHCLTEDHLDTWWASLDPVEKADVYEQHLEAQVVAEDGELSPSRSTTLPELNARVEQMRQAFAAIWRKKYRIDPQPLYTHLQPSTTDQMARLNVAYEQAKKETA